MNEQTGGRLLATDEPVELLSNPGVTARNQALAAMYDELVDRVFARAAEEDLQPRIRAYDNNQRFTFGRAQTSMMPVSQLSDGFDLSWLRRLQFDQPDESCFPVAWPDLPCEQMAEIIDFSLTELLRDDSKEGDAMVTLFAHRTLVSAGGDYPGFFHRDIFPGEGAIGTAVWYPRILHENIKGAELYAYKAGQDVSLGDLKPLEPDFEFSPATYNGSTMIMRYPHNAAHGVRPGRSTHRIGDSHEPLRRFVVPDPDAFVKDLVIITVSGRSPVEH
jgi:hypothetical protein